MTWFRGTLFIAAVAAALPGWGAAQCTAPIDLVFALDASGSVGQSDYDLSKEFMQAVVEEFTIGPAAVSVAVVTFSKYAVVEWGLGAHPVATDLHDEIGNLPYESSWTCTGGAMKKIREEVLCTSCPNYRAEALQVVIFLTDGNPSKKWRCKSPSVDRTDEMDWLKAATNRIVPVGIGSGIATQYLESISWNMPASEPYILAEYATLADILTNLADVACPTPPPSKAPTESPTKEPTKIPTQSPTSIGGCDSDEWSKCDETGNGICACGDAQCSFKQCSCKPGWGCDGSGDGCLACTAAPTKAPSTSPSDAPTGVPTAHPSAAPSKMPTALPTAQPTSFPSAAPSKMPTALPTAQPTSFPTAGPTTAPTLSPSSAPTSFPTEAPSKAPTAVPSLAPTSYPTATPSDEPTQAPTRAPTAFPTVSPSAAPTLGPSISPTIDPTHAPTTAPTFEPSHAPTAQPTKGPTFADGCDATDALECDSQLGICSKDPATLTVHCGCSAGYGCDGAGASGCQYVHVFAFVCAPDTLLPPLSLSHTLLFVRRTLS